MGWKISRAEMNHLFSRWSEQYDIYAPVLKKGEGTFSDIDVVRYDKVKSPEEIEWEKKSDYSFKEVLLPINQTLFYFTEDQTMVPKENGKDLLVFLRSCDLHALKRLDQIYLNNGYEDFYYARVREHVHFALMGCKETCNSGFCVSMGTNQTEDYDLYLKLDPDAAYLDCKNPLFDPVQEDQKNQGDSFLSLPVEPDYVRENKEKVTLPKKLDSSVRENPIWKEYGPRCINCGRCNFVCPTCTCFTMQDIFYGDNPKVGERRRVWASCQIKDYDTIAGGITFRKNNADRVRFKVMHKIYDFEKRFGYPMCVGCGRCDDVCPEYISYSTIINRLAKEEES